MSTSTAHADQHVPTVEDQANTAGSELQVLTGQSTSAGVSASEDSQAKATINSTPAAGQVIHHNGTDYNTIKEGLAYILIPANAGKLTDPKEGSKKGARLKGEKNEEHLVNQSVFYNEIMQYNRDLSVLAIRAYGEDWVQRKTDRFEMKARAFAAASGKGSTKHNQQKHETLKNGASRDADGDKPASSAGGISGVTASNEQQATSGVKRPSNNICDGTEGSQLLAKKPRIEDETIHATELAHTDATGIDESELLDEDLLKVEELSNSIHKPEVKGKIWRTPGFKILDALSATGLRALRYAHELPFVEAIVANDLAPKATKMIAMNVEHNRLQTKITPVTGNALSHMYQFISQDAQGGRMRQYNVIDLDPYGTAAPFLDAAVQALTDGGLLCVTCTDTAVFMSNGYPEKAFSLYGGTPVKGHCAHEGGLRLMLHAIATAAGKHGIAIEPLLSLSIDYYARVFVKVKRSPSDVKFLMSKTMMLNHCDNGCHSIVPHWLGKSTAAEGKKGHTFWKHGYAQQSGGEFCEHCGFKTHTNGPMWGGPLHNPDFINRILSFLPDIDRSTYPTFARIEGMLTTALEELQIFHSDATKPDDAATTIESTDAMNPALIQPTSPEVRDLHPFYVFPSALAKVLHCMAPSEAQIKGALRHAGFKAARTHAARGGIKTDAPQSAIWHIMREWVRQKAPIKKGTLKQGMAGWKILNRHRAAVLSRDADDATVQDGVAADEAKEGDAGVGEEAVQAETAKSTSTTESSFKVVFDSELGKDKGPRLKRFQLNPRANWGPMARAK